MSFSEYGYAVTDKPNDEEWDATDYKIMATGSGGGTFARDNSQATMTYLVEYYYHERFLDVVLGKTVNPGSGGLLRRSASAPEFDSSQGSTPEEHPYYYNFFAASAEVVPAGQPSEDNDGSPLWDKVRITVVFRPNNYLIIPDDDYTGSTEVGRFVTKMQEGSSDFQTAQGQFKFVTDPAHRPLEIQPGIVIANQKLIYVWKQVPVKVVSGYPDLGKIPNLSTVLPLLGQLNQYEWDGYNPGTVLLNGYTGTLVMPQAATANNYYWDVGYAFSVRDYGASATPVVSGEHLGFNYAYDPVRQLWDLYTDDGTASGKTMYQYGNFDALFTVTW